MKFYFKMAIFTGFLTLISAQSYQAGDHELALIPTAYTMDKGQSYITDYELFFVNYSYAVSNQTHISAFSLFPMTSDFIESVSIGIKHKYFENDRTTAAFIASYTLKSKFSTLGTIVSFDAEPSTFHLGTTILNINDEVENRKYREWVYMAGFRKDISKTSSFLLEWANSQTLIEELDFNGMISIGFRFRTHNVAWDLTGIRPLESSGDLVFFPMLKATVLFD